MLSCPKRHNSVKKEWIEGLQARKSKFPGDLRWQKVNSKLLWRLNPKSHVMGRPSPPKIGLPWPDNHFKLDFDVSLPNNNHNQLI